MRKIIAAIAGCLVCATTFAEAPELKNMMPNSWKKLTRLSEAEERAFIGQGEGKKFMDEFKKEYHWKESFDSRVYRESVCGIDFYRLLICSGKFETFLAQTYGDRLLGDDYKSAEYAKFDEMKYIRTAQVVFARGKDDAWEEIWNMEIREHLAIEPISTPWTDGFAFYDLMIRKLNEREIGFFTTEAGIAFREGHGEPVYFPNSEGNPWGSAGGAFGAYCNKTKGQLAGWCTMYFTKRGVDEEIKSARAKDEIRVDGSACLFDPKCPLKYSIQNAFDGDPATSYVENTKDDLMKITFSGCGKKYSKDTKVSIINGYAANENLYTANNRIKTLNAIGYMISAAGNELVPQNPIPLELKDKSMDGQIVDFYFNDRIGGFDFKVTELYKGKTYNDTCLAEFNISEYGDWLFGDIDE